MTKFYECRDCGHEREETAAVSIDTTCPECSGQMVEAGESYPGHPDEWDEVKVDGRWVNKSRIPGRY
ncbi:MAG: hypothetical protein GWN58_26365 [Anaerolineae bacterium]|nr:hypothetical protein [Anaerolineae bacterium]